MRMDILSRLINALRIIGAIGVTLQIAFLLTSYFADELRIALIGTYSTPGVMWIIGHKLLQYVKEKNDRDTGSTLEPKSRYSGMSVANAADDILMVTAAGWSLMAILAIVGLVLQSSIIVHTAPYITAAVFWLFTWLVVFSWHDPYNDDPTTSDIKKFGQALLALGFIGLLVLGVFIYNGYTQRQLEPLVYGPYAMGSLVYLFALASLHGRFFSSNE